MSKSFRNANSHSRAGAYLSHGRHDCICCCKSCCILRTCIPICQYQRRDGLMAKAFDLMRVDVWREAIAFEAELTWPDVEVKALDSKGDLGAAG